MVGSSGNHLSAEEPLKAMKKRLSLIYNMQSEKTDYYSLFTTLSNKYGEPKSLNPTKATWENDEITLTLEKPLSVKYIDNETFDMLKNSSLIEKSFEEKNIQDFLSEF